MKDYILLRETFKVQHKTICSWKMRLFFTFFLCLTFLFVYLLVSNCIEARTASDFEWLAKSYGKNNSFDYFRFTQQWPPSVCVDAAVQHCIIPNNTNFWTIHGLWPDTYNVSDSPSFCNNSWKFNQSEVVPIQDELLSMWPDLIDGKSSRTFWKHEWTKHGTCAGVLPSLNSVLKYFTEGLQLREQYNLVVFLAKRGIEPNNSNPLQFQSIFDAVQENLGVKARIMCSFKKGNKVKKTQPLLSEVQMCYDKKFKPFDCPNSNSTNCPKSGIYYIPF